VSLAAADSHPISIVTPDSPSVSLVTPDSPSVSSLLLSIVLASSLIRDPFHTNPFHPLFIGERIPEEPREH